MKNLKKLLLLLMMTSLFLFSCNKSSGGDHVVDQGEIKSTQEDMDKGTVGIQTSGVKYTLNPEVWGKPFENIHVYNELLEKEITLATYTAELNQALLLLNKLTLTQNYLQTNL